MLALHLIQAELGDCLMVEYGTVQKPRFLLLDGGPRDIFRDHLKKVLEQEVVPKGGVLERVMLSHVDGDHVVGLVDLFVELKRQRDNNEAEVVAIKGLWHNAFTKTIDPNNTLVPRMNGILAVAGIQSLMSVAFESVNTIPQGNKLRQFAQLLNIPINPDTADPITVDSVPAPADIEGLRLTVVGPTQTNLDALRLEWEKWLDDHEDGIINGNTKAMANADKSVPNLSSICVVAEASGKTMLLTGDARSDHLLEGLADKNFLDAQGRAHFDLFKVPHHGSDRNITKRFFKAVTADAYVISANGENGNPDLATLIWLVEAVKEQQRSVDIYLTNSTPSTEKLTEEYPANDYGYTLHFLPPGDSYMRISLA